MFELLAELQNVCAGLYTANLPNARGAVISIAYGPAQGLIWHCLRNL